MTTLPPIRRVAVIGAGAGGLVAARTLLAEKCFDAIDVFEQRDDVGGVWNYTAQTATAAVPSTNPMAVVEPVEVVGDDGEKKRGAFVSAMYDNLETNIPKTLMGFPTHPFPAALPLFPPHVEVLSYLRNYAADGLRHLITFNTQVTTITKSPPPSPSSWTITFASHPPRTYDAVVVATGHYNLPHIPSLPGLTSWPAHKIEHSRNFRHPSAYASLKVLLVGNSASGADIALQLLPYVRLPLLQSIRTPTPTPTPPPTGIQQHPEIAALRAPGEVRFIDGTVETDIDVVLFATGYLFSLPFLDLPLVRHGDRVHGVYQHMFYGADPTLALVGLPTRVTPFPLMQSQAVVVARVFAGRCRLPRGEEMREWERGEEGKRGVGRGFHYFGFPDDAEYIDVLEEIAEDVVDGGAGGEGGLEPARWRERERWVREHILAMRAAFVEAKKRGVVARTMEGLGFVIEA